jgi:hypothetical protein
VTYQIECSDVTQLNIADGLKTMLIEHGFTQQQIRNLEADDLASILGIEDYVAKIIFNAAKRKC